MTAEAAATFVAPVTPTPLRVGGTGICTEPGKMPEVVKAILAEARTWGILGIDLEWNKDGRITWVGLGHAIGGVGRAVSLWWPSMPDEPRQLIRDAFAAEDSPKLGQNGIQADRYVWEREEGPTGGRWEDTMLLHHAAFPGIAHDLQQIVSQFLVVPPWKAWRREDMRKAAEQRRVQAKADKKAVRVAAHDARNAARAAEKQARLDAKKAGQAEKVAVKEAKAAAKTQKQIEHEAKIEAQRAERERKKVERVAAHEARNAASAAAAASGRKKKAPAAPPPAGAVVPKAPEPPAAPLVRMGDDEIPFETLPENGLLCSVCGEPQRMSPHGEICANNHGGAPGIEAEPAAPGEVQPDEGLHVAPAPAPPPAPAPLVLEAPRALLRAPAPAAPAAHKNGATKRMTVVVTLPDGSETIVDPEES